MSLGWISGTSILPTRSEKIEGLSQTNAVELRAALAKAEQEGKDKTVKHDTAKGKNLDDFMKNPGIERRMRNDAETMEKVKDVEGRLQMKADLYEQLRKGAVKLSDKQMEESAIDFEMKIYEESLYGQGRGSMGYSRDTAMQHERKIWEVTVEDETAAEIAKEDRIRLMNEISKETKRARSKVKQLRKAKRKRLEERIELVKVRRERQLVTKREQQHE
eukprot:TRINITY_DN10364_c0_g4_i2.p3 TRINITY_DN10364_c0_g4~~TRINITY_DN10364_c0_g4_i2.p3  ORF type:complete len:218 (+),score=59.40 TRINITY_DN10364_c0_g4_i2:64-717(+)